MCRIRNVRAMCISQGTVLQANHRNYKYTVFYDFHSLSMLFFAIIINHSFYISVAYRYGLCNILIVSSAYLSVILYAVVLAQSTVYLKSQEDAYILLVGFGLACAPVRCAHPSFWAHCHAKRGAARPPPRPSQLRSFIFISQKI
jgi:hypothetical protein